MSSTNSFKDNICCISNDFLLIKSMRLFYHSYHDFQCIFLFVFVSDYDSSIGDRAYGWELVVTKAMVLCPAHHAHHASIGSHTH